MKSILYIFISLILMGCLGTKFKVNDCIRNKYMEEWDHGSLKIIEIGKYNYLCQYTDKHNWRYNRYKVVDYDESSRYIRVNCKCKFPDIID